MSTQQPRAVEAVERERRLLADLRRLRPHAPARQEALQERDPAPGHPLHQAAHLPIPEYQKKNEPQEETEETGVSRGPSSRAPGHGRDVGGQLAASSSAACPATRTESRGEGLLMAEDKSVDRCHDLSTRCCFVCTV
ncbi:hypothetical protein AVEN_21855-1 [Araneus ventricosus]|uniref:Uncharacterized protein n=1 Tax=Araneus ventricosus TaxID=182803 RepID=A0A4Y2RDX7_ARAVE|nr:hypothetical protein AVEN_21855-1 [Araneus ventricosus]